jgi:ABC-2 type transport system permease protein
MSAATEHPAAPAPSASETRDQWLSQARAFAERYARELFRNRAVLFWSVGFPVGFYLLTILVFLQGSGIPERALPSVKAGTAVTYGMFGAIVASLNSFGQQLAMDFEADRYRLYRSLPLAPSADLAGRMAAGVALSLVSMGAVLVVAAVVGGRFALRSVVSAPLVLVAIAAFAVFWMVVSVLLATAVRDARYASLVTVSLALGLYFLTGYNGGDPAMFQGPKVLLNWLPNTVPTRLITDHVVATTAPSTAGSLAPPGTLFGLGLLAVYALGALLVGLAVMRAVVYERGVLP